MRYVRADGQKNLTKSGNSEIQPGSEGAALRKPALAKKSKDCPACPPAANYPFMARAQEDSSSLRFSRRESERVIVALLVSLLAHLAIWGGYHTGEKFGWWQKWHLPAWLQPAAKKFPLQAQIAHNSEPTMFVDVSHADADAPVKPKYYSNKNSRAANADTANANTPKINGRQTDVPKTEDVPKPAPKASNPPPPPPPTKPKAPSKPDTTPQLAKLQPTMPQPSPKAMTQSETPEPPHTPGETDLLTPHTNTPPLTPAAPRQPATVFTPAEPPRPRTLKQALAQKDQIPGQQMQQPGGVARRALWSSLDAKATPFGDYDAAIIEAVSQRWYDLLDNHRYAQDRSGKVMLRFKLKPDGSIIEMQPLENTVGQMLGYLCQEAIEEAAPFAKWPPDMSRMIGANYRDITFTFYYY